MLAPLATLAFLATLWLVSIVIANLFSHGPMIIAALNGQSVLATMPAIRPIAVRVSQRSRAQRSLRAQPQLRAAA